MRRESLEIMDMYVAFGVGGMSQLFPCSLGAHWPAFCRSFWLSISHDQLLDAARLPISEMLKYANG
jgi:hypothetical protein